MHLLSVAVITKNEESNLKRCLQSVSSIADEILVVDSYSKDQTEAIAKAFNARFVQHAFEGHIEQKNYALQLTSHQLVLSLDADEALDEILLEEIKKIKTQHEPKAFAMNRLNNYCGKWIRHGTWYPDKRVRLVNKNIAAWGGRNPHDKLIPNENINVISLKGNILHYTINSLEEHLRQINYFSTLAAKSKFEANVKYHWWQLILNPPWRFIKEYFIKAGFLDGYEGFQIALMSAHAGFLRYAKLRELWNAESKKQP
ncbi:MAG: glycosyltransferase family 2 protein [Bacteroidia bacterium]|nr:glycosyltransferase family 2 protein [Bacteroidia bacterium]